MFKHEVLILEDGRRIAVTKAGRDGPVLVFLHYWGGSGRTWKAVVDVLQHDHRCFAIDFPGWGNSADEGGAGNLGSLADLVIEVIGRLELHAITLVGHSMGGKVAQLVAARLQQGLSALVLIAPAPPTPLAVPPDQRRAMMDSYRSREGAEAAIGILSARPLSAAVRERIVEDTLRGSAEARRAWPERGMLEDISEEAAAIRTPVQIVVGDADVVESEASLRAAFSVVIPEARFVVLSGVGHLSPLEAIDDVANAVLSAAAGR